MIYLQAKDGSYIAEGVKEISHLSLPSNISVNEMISRQVPIRITVEGGYCGVCFPDGNEPAFYIGPIDPDFLAESPHLIDELTEKITQEEFEALINTNKEGA